MRSSRSAITSMGYELLLYIPFTVQLLITWTIHAPSLEGVHLLDIPILLALIAIRHFNK